MHFITLTNKGTSYLVNLDHVVMVTPPVDGWGTRLTVVATDGDGWIEIDQSFDDIVAAIQTAQGRAGRIVPAGTGS